MKPRIFTPGTQAGGSEDKRERDVHQLALTMHGAAHIMHGHLSLLNSALIGLMVSHVGGNLKGADVCHAGLTALVDDLEDINAALFAVMKDATALLQMHATHKPLTRPPKES